MVCAGAPALDALGPEAGQAQQLEDGCVGGPGGGAAPLEGRQGPEEGRDCRQRIAHAVVRPERVARVAAVPWVPRVWRVWRVWRLCGSGERALEQRGICLVQQLLWLWLLLLRRPYLLLLGAAGQHRLEDRCDGGAHHLLLLLL
jgi:hypothetical protein